MAWEWALAEIDSDRFGELYGGLEPRIREALRRGARDELSPRDLDVVKIMVRAVRRPVLEDLLELGTDWRRGEMRLAEVGNLRVVNWPPLAELDPSRTIGAIARFLDGGGIPPDDRAFADNYRKLHSGFSLTAMRGQPILISETEGGPNSVLEGYTRLSVIASKTSAGQIVDQALPVIVGTCPRLRDWCLWQTTNGRWIRTRHHMM